MKQLILLSACIWSLSLATFAENADETTLPLSSVNISNKTQQSHQCSTTLPLNGMLSIPTCDHAKKTCIAADQAILQYLQNKQDRKDTVEIFAHGSPWHFYNTDMRILTASDMAKQIRPMLKAKRIKKVQVNTSWSGVAPDTRSKSLVRQLAEQLPGISVVGQDGFVWLNEQGKIHTTQHAYTLRKNGFYEVAQGADVFVAMVMGNYLELEPQFREQKNADGLLRVAAAWDVFGLCQPNALQRFEEAAQLGHAIAAYNVAILQLEQGNQEAAITWLNRAAQAGDQAATEKLRQLKQAK